MKKWKRSLSMLLTIAMIAGNYEPFVLSAHAATESSAIAEGLGNTDPLIITREDDGTTVITSDALNSNADEGEPEDDENTSGDDADASGDDDSDHNGSGDNGNGTTGDNGNGSDDNGSNGNGSGNNGNDTDDNGNGSGDDSSNGYNGNSAGNNASNSGDDSASDNDADNDTHNDDTDLPDNNDSVSDNNSVSDNSSDDDSVSDNSVSENTVSENSVSENVITEQAMNGSALNTDAFNHTLFFPDAKWVELGTCGEKTVYALEVKLDDRSTDPTDDTVTGLFMAWADDAEEVVSSNSVQLFDPGATAEENAGANAENVEGKGAYFHWSGDSEEFKITHIYRKNTPIGERLNPYWIHNRFIVENANDGMGRRSERLWTMENKELVISGDSGTSVSYYSDASVKMEDLAAPYTRFNISSVGSELMTVEFYPYGPGAEVIRDEVAHVQRGSSNTPIWIGDAGLTDQTHRDETNPVLVYHSLENGIGFSYFPQGPQQDYVAEKVIVRYRTRKSATDFTYETGEVECMKFTLAPNTSNSSVTDLKLDILGEKVLPTGAEIYEVELVAASGVIELRDATSTLSYSFMTASSLENAVKQAESYHSNNPETKVELRLLGDVTYGSAGTASTICFNGPDKDSSGLTIDLNGHTLTVEGALTTNGALIKNGNISLAENAKLLIQSPKGGEGLDITTLTAGKGSKFTVGGTADVQPTIARIRDIGTEEDPLPSLTIGQNSEVYLTGESYFGSLSLDSRANNVVKLFVNGDMYADQVSAGSYAVIKAGYHVNESGKWIDLEGNETTNPDYAQPSTIKFNSLSIGSDFTFCGAGMVETEKLTGNRSTLHIGEEGQNENIMFAITKTTGTITGTLSKVEAYHASVILAGFNIGSGSFALAGDRSSITLTRMTSASTAVITVGDDQTDDNGTPKHAVRVYFADSTGCTLKSLDIRKSGEVILDGKQKYTITTLTVSPDAGIFVEQGSTLNCTATANLSADSRLYVRGTANLKNIALKTASGRDGLHVDFVTDELTDSALGRINIDGTITSDSYTDANGNVRQGIIRLKHPKSYDDQDWEKDIAGFASGTILLYSKNNNNAGFFRAYYGSVAGGYTEQGTVYTVKDGAYYKLILRTIKLYAHEWDPEQEDLVGSAQLPLTQYSEAESFNSTEALFAWLGEKDGEGKAVNLDPDGKTVYRIVLEDAYASSQSIEVPATLNGIIIEGADANAQVRLEVPALCSGTKLLLGNLDLRLSDRLECTAEHPSDWHEVEHNDVILAGTRIEAGSVIGEYFSAYELYGGKSEIHADTIRPETDGFLARVRSGADLQCYVKESLQIPNGLEVHGTLGLHGNSSQTTTAELSTLGYYPGAAVEIDHFLSLKIWIGEDEPDSFPAEMLEKNPQTPIFLHDIGAQGIKVGYFALYNGASLVVKNASVTVENGTDLWVNPGSELVLENAPFYLGDGDRLYVSSEYGKIVALRGLNTQETAVLEKLYAKPAVITADGDSPITIVSPLNDALQMYPDAKLYAYGGLSVIGKTVLWDNAQLYADGKASFNDLKVIVSKVNPRSADGSFERQPVICTADGVCPEIDGGISIWEQETNAAIDPMDSVDGRYPIALRLYGFDYSPRLDGGMGAVAKSHTADDEILNIHKIETTAAELNADLLTIGAIVVPDSNGKDAGNYFFCEVDGRDDTYVLKIVAIEVYSMPAEMPLYSSMKDNGTRLGDFTTYDEAVNYISSVANAGQKYYIYLPTDTRIVGTDLALPATAARIVICGDRNAAGTTVLDATNVRTAVKLTNHLMFQDITVKFADGTVIDLNGKNLNICDADLKGVSGIKGKGDLELFTENLDDHDCGIFPRGENLPYLRVTNGIAATNLTVTNYNIVLNDQNESCSGKLSITGDVYAYQSIISGIGNGSSVAGNLYLSNSECRIGAPVYTVTTKPRVAFGVGKDVILNCSDITNGDGKTGANDTLKYGAQVSLTVSGSVYMNYALIALTGDITIKKNLYTGSDENRILYGTGAGNKFTIAGKTSDVRILLSMSRNLRNTEFHELYSTVNWDWIGLIRETAPVADIEPVALSSTDRAGHFIVHANAVHVRRLSIEDPGDEGMILENDYSHLIGIATSYSDPVYKATAIVSTKSDPLFFRIGDITDVWKGGSERTKDYSVCGLKASGANLILNTQPDMAAVLYLADSAPGRGDVAIGNYATLQAALDAIKARNDKNASYVIEIRDYHATGIWDGANYLGAEDPVFPDKAALITIRKDSASAEMGLYFKNKLTLNTNVTLCGITPVPTGTQTQGGFRGAVAVDLKSFTLTLENCNLVELNGGDHKDPASMDTDGKAYFHSITGNGETRTSGLVIRYDAHPSNAAVWVYGEIKGVGTLSLKNATMCAAENVSVGRITSAGSGYSALYTMAEVKGDTQSGYTVTPKFAVSASVTATEDSKLYLAQMVKADGTEGLKYDRLPAGLQTVIRTGTPVPVLKNGTVSGKVYYGFAELTTIKEPTPVEYPVSVPGVFLRSTVGNVRYLCYTTNGAVPYMLSGNGQAIVGANDWATIRSEIETINNADAEYVVTLRQTDANGNINIQAETLTMPKSSALRSLKITTGSSYNNGDTIPAWNYIGDTITLNCDTTFENVRLVGYKTATVSEENRLSVVTAAKINKPTLTIKIGGAYAMLVEGNMIIDSRQLFLDGGKNGRLLFEQSSNAVDRQGSLRTTDTFGGKYDTDDNHYSNCVDIRGKIKNLADFRFSRGGTVNVKGYVTKACADQAALNSAKLYSTEFAVSDLEMNSCSLYVYGIIRVTHFYALGACDIGDAPGSEVRKAYLIISYMVASGAVQIRADSLSVGTLTVSDGVSVDVDNLKIQAKLIVEANEEEHPDTVNTLSAINGIGIIDLEAYSDNLLLRTMYQSEKNTGISIAKSVNTDETVIENGEEKTVHHTVRVAIADPAGIGSQDGDYSIDMLDNDDLTRVPLVTAEKGTADQFVAAYSADNKNGERRIYDSKDNPNGHQTMKNGKMIYAYRGDQIGVALLTAEAPAAGNLPKISNYHTDGKLDPDRLIAYYPTFADAVTAINDRKNTAQGYAIVLLSAADNGAQRFELADNAGIKTPTKAKFVHICALNSDTVLSFTGNSSFTTDVYFQDLKLENRNTSTPGKSAFYGYNFNVSGAHILSFDGVTAENGTVSVTEKGTEKLYQRNAIANIAAEKGTVIVTGCSIVASGTLTAKDLYVKGFGASKPASLTVYKKTTVNNLLSLEDVAKLVLHGESKLADIRSGGDANTIQFGRLKGDKTSLTVSGKMTGPGVTFCLEPFYYPAFDKPAETLTAKAEGAAAAYLLPFTNGVTQELPENRLLFKAPELEMNQFTYLESDVSGLALYKANGAYYASADASMASYSVKINHTTYLDLNQAVQRINAIKDQGREYTISIQQDLKDLNRTDKVMCSAFPEVKDKAAASVSYRSSNVEHRIYFSGSPTFRAGAKGGTDDYKVHFLYLLLCPSAPKYDGNDPVPAADGSVTLQIKRNTGSKGRAELFFQYSAVEGSALKSISGVKGVTVLTLDLKKDQREMMLTDGITNFDLVNVAEYNKICMNGISNVGSLRLNRLSRFIVTGTGSVGQIIIDDKNIRMNSSNKYYPTLCVGYTETGRGSSVVRSPKFTLSGGILSTEGRMLVIEPLRPNYTGADGKTAAISPKNYMRTETTTDEDGRVYVTEVGRNNYTVTGPAQVDLPLINAKQGNPEWITVDWNGPDLTIIGIPQMKLGSAPAGVAAYKDASGVIRMTDVSSMTITVSGYDLQPDKTKQTFVNTSVATWEDAVKIIDNQAHAGGVYDITFKGGEYPMGRNGAISAMLWPKAANVSALNLIAYDNSGDHEVTLQYVGALNPVCDVKFGRVGLIEYKNATSLSPTKSIHTSNAVTIGFDHTYTGGPGDLSFDKVTVKKGTILLDNTILFSDGTMEAATVVMNGTSDVTAISSYYAPKASDITISDVRVTGTAMISGYGKITLGTIKGESDPAAATSETDPVDAKEWEDTIWLDAYFSEAKPGTSVSKLTISGRVEGLDVAVTPYFYDWDTKSYADDAPTLQELRDRGMVYRDAGKAPVKNTQLLNAPYLNLTDLYVATSTPDPEDPTEDLYLYGAGFADDFVADEDHPGEWLTWYEGNVYVTDLPAVTDVTDCTSLVSTRFTNWDQAASYVDKTAQTGRSYKMYLHDDVGVTSYRDVYEYGVVTGREPSAVAKTFVLPNTKLPEDITIVSKGTQKGFYASATGLSVNAKMTLENVGLYSLKSNKGILTMQDINLDVAAGGRLKLSGEIDCYGIGTVKGTATSRLEIHVNGGLDLKGELKTFEKVTVGGSDVNVNGDVSVTDLELSGAELHAANITVTGLTDLYYGKGWSPAYAGFTVFRPSTLAADRSEAVGKGSVTLGRVISNVGSADGVTLGVDCTDGNNIVSKLNAKGQSQLTIKGDVGYWLYDEGEGKLIEQESGSGLCLSFLYGRGNDTYAVLLADQILVNCTGNAQANTVAERSRLGYASTTPVFEETRGNRGKVSGIRHPELTVPVGGKTVIVTDAPST